MKKARIAELRASLSRYLKYVRGGGTVLVLDRDIPVARLVPLEPPVEENNGKASRARIDDRPHPHAKREDDESRLARLERAGVIKRGKGNVLEWLRTRKLVTGIKGSVLQDLLDERESGW